MKELNKFDILLVAQRAKDKKENGENVVDCSIGSLMDEDGKLLTYKEINELMKVNLESFLGYSTQLGPESFRNGYLSWIFEDKLDLLKEKHNVSISATSGGTEALFLTFRLLKDTHTCLLPNLKWPNYNNLIELSEIKYEEFKRYDENNHFNFEGLKEKIENINGKVLLTINDPCHNPTGYSLNESEYDELFNLINSFDDKVTLFLDLAYIDYSSTKDMIINKIINSNLKNPIFLAFSCSKSFAIYGLRMGAIITIFNKNEKDIYTESFKKIIRGTVSSSNHLASGSLGLFFKDKEKVNTVKNHIKEQTERLKNKGKKVEMLLKNKGFNVLPYNSGFYISFFATDSKKLLEELENKNIFFTYINDNMVRVAICSIKDSDIKYLEEHL